MNQLYPSNTTERNNAEKVNQRSITPLVTVHALIADAYRSGEAALWYYLRHLDQAGEGVVSFVVKEACKVLNVSSTTIGRWLEFGGKREFFRNVIKSYGRVTVWLGARDKVAFSLGLERLGATARVPIERLQHIKLTSTEISADMLQSCSRYAMKEQLRERDPQRAKLANKLEDVFLTSSESSTGENVGHIIHVGKRCAFVDESFTAFGASQEGIARYIGRSVATVQRRLSNAYRSSRRKPTPLVLKRQLAQLDIPFSSVEGLEELRSAQHELGRDAGLDRFFAYRRGDFVRTFFALTNLYWLTDVEITSHKAAKWRYKNFVRKMQGLPLEVSEDNRQRKAAREGREGKKPAAANFSRPISHLNPSSLVKSRVPILKKKQKPADQGVYGFGLDSELERVEEDLGRGVN